MALILSSGDKTTGSTPLSLNKTFQIHIPPKIVTPKPVLPPLRPLQKQGKTYKAST